jgi:hypothetical protein
MLKWVVRPFRSQVGQSRASRDQIKGVCPLCRLISFLASRLRQRSIWMSTFRCNGFIEPAADALYH